METKNKSSNQVEIKNKFSFRPQECFDLVKIERRVLILLRFISNIIIKNSWHGAGKETMSLPTLDDVSPGEAFA